MRLALRVLWIVAGLALILGRMSDAFQARLPRARLLTSAEAAANGSWFTGGFRVSGVYPTTEAGLLPASVPTLGSWVDSDEWQGQAETAWFSAPDAIVRVAVAGYSRHPGCRLRAEFRHPDGKVTASDCPLPNARELWSVWSIRVPRGATALRLLAEDHSAANAGWLAFSHPFTTWRYEATALYQFLQVVATTALALFLIWGPGIAVYSWWQSAQRPLGDPWRTVLLLGTGPMLLVASGIAIWCGSGRLAPQSMALGFVGAIGLALGAWVWRRGFELNLSRSLVRILGLSALITAAVVAKSCYSIGPQGELFRGTVSRNFQMADRIDSRYSYYVVQTAAHLWSPASPAAEKLFHPWTFFSRGPLAGLTSAPVVLATFGKPPVDVPENRWTPYDTTGFTAYRITMMTLASTIIVAVFLVLIPLAGEWWAAIAAGLLALSPFGVHEVMFTWPKWIATTWLLVSFGLVHARQFLGAGLMLGIGFLFHPLVLLWAPWLALWSAARSERRPGAILGAVAKLAGAAGIIVVPWMATGALMPHLSTTPLPGQVGFLHYWARADWKIPTWQTWWSTRWMNFANTFLPLHLYLSDSGFNHPKLSSAYETSGRLVRFSLLWWNTLPFALGLGLWITSMAATLRAATFMLGALLILIVGPALFITAYWGMDPLGLMRECGHPLFVALIGVTCVAASRRGGWIGAALSHRATPWLQLPETWLMLWLTSLLNPAPWAADHAYLDPLYLTLNALALLAAAWVLSRLRATPSPIVSSVLADEMASR